MVLFPNAKINIGLNILRKRKDGYHEIETLFYPVGLKDALEFVLNGTNNVNFCSSGLDLHIPSDQNIVLKAYKLLSENFLLPGMDINLHKAIPSGAGLGGGSADAAFFLKSLNEYLDLNISLEKLRGMAGRLGADCAFFIENRPSYATGVGEVLTPADVSLKGYILLLVKPPYGVETREAYSGVVPRVFPLVFKEAIEEGPAKWSGGIRNDFEESIFLKYPGIRDIKIILSGMGAVYASMSGSGSSVYGLFEKDPGVKTEDFPPGSFVWQEILT
jgi:4-diphosphocytidyl-2-C-methyl-D-erythritol kinase